MSEEGRDDGFSARYDCTTSDMAEKSGGSRIPARENAFRISATA